MSQPASSSKPNSPIRIWPSTSPTTSPRFTAHKQTWGKEERLSSSSQNSGRNTPPISFSRAAKLSASSRSASRMETSTNTPNTYFIQRIYRIFVATGAGDVVAVGRGLEELPVVPVRGNFQAEGVEQRVNLCDERLP